MLKLVSCFVVLIGVIVIPISSVHAQPIAVNASVSKNKVLLGEPFWLTLEVKTLNRAKAPAFQIDSIAHFEFLIKDSVATIQQKDTTIFRQYYKLTSFDSGRWVIPQFTLRPFVKTKSILMDVVYTDNFDPKQPYHDVQSIKDIPFKIPSSIERWWYLIALTLILITLLIYWITQPKRPKVVKIVVSSETPFDKAIRSLAELKSEHKGEQYFYAQLVEIFRTYITERTGITSLQQTSNNLVEQIKPLIQDEIQYDSLSQVLFLCDFVKFAKYHPEDSETVSAFEVVETSIHYIESELKKKQASKA